LENESEWHRNWKDQFPAEWQEHICRAADGEKHVADVLTDHGWVIEFQRSYIKPEERRSRDIFYRKLVWVVDATRRETDREQFLKALQASAPVGLDPQSPIRRVRSDQNRLLQEWCGSPAPVFFDFGSGPALWWLLARRPDEPMYLAPWSRETFIATHHGKGPEGARNFDEFATTVNRLVAQYNANRSQAATRTAPQAAGFQVYMARRRDRRRL
jgi:hypothetical protein